MIVFDFLFYYLTCWFEKNEDKLKWSTPPQRAAYALGLATMSFMLAICSVYEHIVIHNKIYIPKFLFLIAGLSTIKLYEYIYVDKKRYEKIKSYFHASIVGTIITIVVTALLLMSAVIVPFILYAIKRW